MFLNQKSVSPLSTYSRHQGSSQYREVVSRQTRLAELSQQDPLLTAPFQNVVIDQTHLASDKSNSEILSPTEESPNRTVSANKNAMFSFENQRRANQSSDQNILAALNQNSASNSPRDDEGLYDIPRSVIYKDAYPEPDQDKEGD